VNNDSSKKIIIILIFLISGGLGFALSFYKNFSVKVNESQDNDVQVIQTFHYPALFVHQLENDPEAGRKIYKEFCSSCHSENPKIDINAPRINDKAAWAKRRKWCMAVLERNTIEGAGAMPARGGCFECSDEQLRQAIAYMLEQEKAS
jgi:cytochrome c5